MQIDKNVKKAFTMAQKVLKNSYSPYSQLQVASVIKLKGMDQYIPGVNVENGSFGATICAERSAIVSGRSQWGIKFKPEFIVIISSFNGQSPIPPCGMCLQVLSEFTKPDFKIYLGDTKNITVSLGLKDFLPRAFSFDSNSTL